MKEVPWHVVRTRGGLEIQLEEASGRVAISMPDGTSVTVDNGKVVIEAAAFMEIDASQVKVSAGVINVTAGYEGKRAHIELLGLPQGRRRRAADNVG
jgi:hypothetical protein